MPRFFPLFLLLTPLLADQITLNNGDRLTGSIVRANSANLVIDTGSAGTVTIAWDSIAAIASEAPLFVALSDGRTLSGAVTTAGAQFQIATQDQGVVTVPRDMVAAIRNQAEQARYQRMLAPSLLDLWAGFLDLGLAASRGNANTSTFTLSANASRTTNTDKLGAYFTSIYSSSDVSGERETTANSKRGGVSYNRNADSRLFYFGSLDLEADEFQNLDLRVVPAGGGGYHAIRRDSTTLDFRLGVSGNLEYFSTGLERKSTEALLGQELVYRFSADTSVNQRFAYFGNLSNTGAHRINFDTSFATRLNGWLSFQLTVSDRYLSNPVPGRKTNDILFSAGVRLSFSQ
jgi:putative salt-induced outer membrane protein YdiY